MRGVRHPFPGTGGAIRGPRGRRGGGLSLGRDFGARRGCEGLFGVIAPSMKRVFRAALLVQVAHARNVLVTAGIPCEMRNQYLAGAMGELPMLETWPQLFVDDADEQAALRALAR